MTSVPAGNNLESFVRGKYIPASLANVDLNKEMGTQEIHMTLRLYTSRNLLNWLSRSHDVFRGGRGRRGVATSILTHILNFTL